MRQYNVYVCEKCRLVYNAEYDSSECESSSCTYIRKVDEREVLLIVGSMFLNTDESVLFKEKRGGK